MVAKAGKTYAPRAVHRSSERVILSASEGSLAPCADDFDGRDASLAHHDTGLVSVF
jgi:hypothetical protein